MAAKKALTFVTGNANKLREVSQILGDSILLTSKAVDLPELQGDDDYIAIEKCKIAAAEVGGPVICEDTSLQFNAYNGLPGPYIKYFLEKLGHDGLNKMLTGFDDKTGKAVCIFSFSMGPGEEITIFRGETPGRIVPARGPTNFGWDPIFEPEGFDQTYAELDKEIKNTISHRYRALEKLKAFLVERNLFVNDSN